MFDEGGALDLPAIVAVESDDADSDVTSLVGMQEKTSEVLPSFIGCTVKLASDNQLAGDHDSKEHKLSEAKVVITPVRSVEHTTGSQAVKRSKSDRSIDIDQYLVTSFGTMYFKCFCGAQFSERKEMQVHLLEHSISDETEREITKTKKKDGNQSSGGTKDYSCEICSKTFKFCSDLMRHKVKHSKKKPYPCSKCGKYFKTAGSRTVHQKHNKCRTTASDTATARPKIRARERNGKYTNLACQFCSKMFKYPSDFIRHLKTRHSRQTRFSCPVCHQDFKTVVRLEQHLKQKTCADPPDDQSIKDLQSCGADSERQQEKLEVCIEIKTKEHNKF